MLIGLVSHTERIPAGQINARRYATSSQLRRTSAFCLSSSLEP